VQVSVETGFSAPYSARSIAAEPAKNKETGFAFRPGELKIYAGFFLHSILINKNQKERKWQQSFV
jgi:hypothetical protein